MGNNLDMLEPGDKWCLCAKRWEEANKEGVAPEMIKSSTNIKTLDIINNEKYVNMNLQESIRRILREEMKKESEWGNSKKKLSKEFKFKDFEESMNFVNKIAKITKVQNHHPNLEIGFNNVKVTISDHDEGGVSVKCHRLAKAIDELEENKLKMKEGVLTEKCWSGYTQKGMKTMFGKRYPNCVKIKKK